MIYDLTIYTLVTYILCITDNLINNLGYKNPYYLIHTIINGVITYQIFPVIKTIYFDFQNSDNIETDINPMLLCLSLHIYHIIHYRKSIDFQDYIHHIPTISILCYSLFISDYNGPVIAHILFYLCGLPGGIDYLLLFLVRNGIINRLTEKKVNTYLNLLIRYPGSVISSFITIVYSQYNQISLFGCIITSLFTFVNGAYYTNRVMESYFYEKKNTKLNII